MGEYIQFPLVSNLGYVSDLKALDDLTTAATNLLDAENEKLEELNSKITNIEHSIKVRAPAIFIQNKVEIESGHQSMPFQLQLNDSTYIIPDDNIPSGFDAKIDNSKQTTYFKSSVIPFIGKVTYRAFKNTGHDIKITYEKDGLRSPNVHTIAANQNQIYLTDVVYFAPNSKFSIDIESEYKTKISQGVLMFEILSN